MLRACTDITSPLSVSEPTITSRAPTSCPTRITVASVSDADCGTCRRSNAWLRSSRVIALTPSARRSSASSTADASPSQNARLSARSLANGITRMREGPRRGLRCARASPSSAATAMKAAAIRFTAAASPAAAPTRSVQASLPVGRARDDRGLERQGEGVEQHA